MFYDLSRDYGTQKVRFVSIEGLLDQFVTGIPIKRYVQVSAIVLPTKGQWRTFYTSSYTTANRKFAYGGEETVFSLMVMLDVGELKRKNLLPKLEDFIILNQGHRHQVASIQETIEDVVVLMMSATKGMANNDYIEVSFGSQLSMGDIWSNH